MRVLFYTAAALAANIASLSQAVRLDTDIYNQLMQVGAIENEDTHI